MYDLLLNLFGNSVEVNTISQSIEEGINPVLIHGSEPQVMKWVAQRISKSEQKTTLVFFEDEHKAKLAAEEVEGAIFLPSREIIWFDAYAHSNQVGIDRVEALIQASKSNSGLLFASITNLSYRYAPKNTLIDKSIVLDMSVEMPLDSLQKALDRKSVV